VDGVSPVTVTERVAYVNPAFPAVIALLVEKP